MVLPVRVNETKYGYTPIYYFFKNSTDLLRVRYVLNIQTLLQHLSTYCFTTKPLKKNSTKLDAAQNKAMMAP